MANRFEPGNTTADSADVISNAWAVWVKNILAGGSAAGGTEVYFSPTDLTATWASATTLNIAAITLPAVPVTEQFIKVVEFRAGGVAVTYAPDQYQFGYAAGVLTVTGAAFVNTSTFRVEILMQAKSVAIQAAAAPDLATLVAGHDGTNVRAHDVDATRRLSTRDDQATGTSDVAALTTGYLTGAMAHSGNPTPVSADARFVRVLATLLGQLRVYMDSALNRVNDEVKNEDIPPPEIVAGGVRTTDADITVNTPVQLTATSVTLKRGVWLRVSPKFGSNAMGGAHFTSTDNSIISAAGLPVAGRMFLRDEGEIFIPCDDPSKIFVASDTNSTIIVWSAV